MSIRLPLSALIYPRECVEQTISAYAQLCLVDVGEVTPTGCCIDIRPHPGIEWSEDRLACEFLNYLLDVSVEKHLGAA